jgi:alanyl-tRNA synthetase
MCEDLAKLPESSGHTELGTQRMTDRLYYHDPFLYEFDAEVTDVIPQSKEKPRPAVVLDRTAFYPTSGGQVFDTGWIVPASETESSKLRVTETSEEENDRIVHYLEAERAPEKGSRVRGFIDPSRRRDHMQQHSGQHLLSAAFVRLFNMPTVSFHMGDEYCSIGLETPSLTPDQAVAAERLANEIILENRQVDIRFVTQAEARSLGLRKIPPVEKDELRLIDIHDFDVTACGGTHVRFTGQIGCILLRRTEKVRQGYRVEFVCGQRTVATSRRDYSALTEAASLFSAHIWDVPQQVRKSLDEIKAARKAREQLLEELAKFQAKQLLAEAERNHGRILIVQIFPDRDVSFLKMLAQKLTRLDLAAIALLASTSGQPCLVFAQSPGQPFDMSALMKEAMSRLGGRGGGSKDLAQGGAPQADAIPTVLGELAGKLAS